MPASTERTSLRELALLFLRLGATSFGGPAAHVAIMEQEVVRRRRWLDHAYFLDLLGATNLIPGPNSTELAIHIGWHQRRWAGLLVAGTCFVLPAMLIAGVLGWMYVRYGDLPQVDGLWYGMKPVVLALIAHALWTLSPRAMPRWPLRFLGAGAVIAAMAGVHELLVLFGSGLVAMLPRLWASRGRPGDSASMSALVAAGVGSAAVVKAGAGGIAVATGVVTLPALFGIFLKVGSTLFGSGYVLVALLRADLVERLNWLTEGELVDAIAMGQATPGPVLNAATFIGYLLAGPGGALVATLGIFLPAFVLVALSGPLVPRLRSSPMAGGVLDGIVVASLALMAAVVMTLGRVAVVDSASAILALISMTCLLRFKSSASWLVPAGAVAGLAIHGLGWGG